MKTLKDIREDIANVSAGIGVRGFGDVTGTPKIGEEDNQDNPHIDRVMQGAEENNSAVDQFIKNNTDGIYTWEGGFDWWADRKGVAKYTKTHSAEPLGFRKLKPGDLKEGLEKDHYKAIDDVHVNLENRNHAIDEYGYGPMNPNEDSTDFWKQKAKLWKNTVEEAKKSRCGNCAAFNQSKEIIKRIADALGPAGEKITEMSGLGYCEMFHFKCAASRTCDAWLVNGPIKEEVSGTVTTDAAPGMGDNPTKEVFPGKTKKNKPVWPMFRRLPLQLEEIGGIGGTVGGTSVGTGYIAGTGHPLEGKPSNWGEPGVQPKDQPARKKKRKVDDPRAFSIFRRKSFTQYLKERQK